MRGSIGTTLLILGFRDQISLSAAIGEFFWFYGGLEESALEIQKLLNLREAAQEVLASPVGSTVIEPPAEWPA
jgi:hypothetical protein